MKIGNKNDFCFSDPKEDIHHIVDKASAELRDWFDMNLEESNHTQDQHQSPHN